MIIARSPLRVTLGGGGTDLPSYYEPFGGFLIAAAIDKYVYITLHETFVADLIVKYSELERVPEAARLKHPIIREALKLMNFKTPQIEITTLADIPSGTGLGSSGSFTTALLKALFAHRRRKALCESGPGGAQKLAVRIQLIVSAARVVIAQRRVDGYAGERFAQFMQHIVESLYDECAVGLRRRLRKQRAVLAGK